MLLSNPVYYSELLLYCLGFHWWYLLGNLVTMVWTIDFLTFHQQLWTNIFSGKVACYAGHRQMSTGKNWPDFRLVFSQAGFQLVQTGEIWPLIGSLCPILIGCVGAVGSRLVLCSCQLLIGHLGVLILFITCIPTHRQVVWAHEFSNGNPEHAE